MSVSSRKTSHPRTTKLPKRFEDAILPQKIRKSGSKSSTFLNLLTLSRELLRCHSPTLSSFGRDDSSTEAAKDAPSFGKPVSSDKTFQRPSSPQDEEDLSDAGENESPISVDKTEISQGRRRFNESLKDLQDDPKYVVLRFTDHLVHTLTPDDITAGNPLSFAPVYSSLYGYVFRVGDVVRAEYKNHRTYIATIAAIVGDESFARLEHKRAEIMSKVYASETKGSGKTKPAEKQDIAQHLRAQILNGGRSVPAPNPKSVLHKAVVSGVMPNRGSPEPRRVCSPVAMYDDDGSFDGNLDSDQQYNLSDDESEVAYSEELSPRGPSTSTASGFRVSTKPCKVSGNPKKDASSQKRASVAESMCKDGGGARVSKTKRSACNEDTTTATKPKMPRKEINGKSSRMLTPDLPLSQDSDDPRYPYTVRGEKHGDNKKVRISGIHDVFIFQTELESLLERCTSRPMLANYLALHLLGGNRGVRRFYEEKGVGNGIVKEHTEMVEAISAYVHKVKTIGGIPQSGKVPAIGHNIGSFLYHRVHQKI